MRNETAAEHLARATIGRDPKAVAAAVARQAARRGGGAGAAQTPSLTDSRKILELGAAMRELEKAKEPLPILDEEGIKLALRIAAGSSPLSALRSLGQQQRERASQGRGIQAHAGPNGRSAATYICQTGPLSKQLAEALRAPATGTAHGTAQRLR
jgi:hypothetical protein